MVNQLLNWCRWRFSRTGSLVTMLFSKDLFSSRSDGAGVGMSEPLTVVQPHFLTNPGFCCSRKTLRRHNDTMSFFLPCRGQSLLTQISNKCNKTRHSKLTKITNKSSSPVTGFRFPFRLRSPLAFPFWRSEAPVVAV